MFIKSNNAHVRLAQEWPKPEAKNVKSLTEDVREAYSFGTLGILFLMLTTIGVVDLVCWAY